MSRKTIGVVWLVALAFVPFRLAEAQQPKKVPRIGFLLAPSRSAVSESLDAFRQGLRELGYVEGKNIVIEYRYAEGRLERLPDLASELVRLKVDVIVAAGGMQVIRPAKNATGTIPIVMTGAWILLLAGSLPASRGRVATSLGFRLVALSCTVNDWSF